MAQGVCDDSETDRPTECAYDYAKHDVIYDFVRL